MRESGGCGVYEAAESVHSQLTRIHPPAHVLVPLGVVRVLRIRHVTLVEIELTPNNAATCSPRHARLTHHHWRDEDFLRKREWSISHGLHTIIRCAGWAAPSLLQMWICVFPCFEPMSQALSLERWKNYACQVPRILCCASRG